MKVTKLKDGTKVFCIQKAEAKVLDYHVAGYFAHGIKVNDGDTVMDVGANIGVFGTRVLQQHPNAKVYAFEPMPAIYNVLKANAASFGDKFVPLNMGVGKERDELSFRYYPNSPALSTAHPEVWEDNPENLTTATLSNIRNGPPEFKYLRWLPRFVARMIANHLRKGAQNIKCPIVPLSEVMKEHSIDHIDLLKIDCEGAEYDVLLGIASEDWGKVRQVVIEVYNEDDRIGKVHELLKQKGFEHIVIEEEQAMKGSNLYNVYARRA